MPGNKEAYLRLGHHNDAEETRYLDLSAFAAPDTATGIFFGTEGDLVQVVRGRADTRVVDGNFVVLVEDKLNVDAALEAEDGRKTYRSYLRLGQPDPELEGAVGSEAAKYSLGTGVTLYSDQVVAVETPRELRVTVGGDSRTVFGPTFSVNYDVDDATIAKVRAGGGLNLSAVGKKRIVTTTKVGRDHIGDSWRTTKIDRSKSLTFGMGDKGDFSLSSSMSSTYGLKLSGGVTASFDMSAGFSAKASFSKDYKFSDWATKKDQKSGYQGKLENR